MAVLFQYFIWEKSNPGNSARIVTICVHFLTCFKIDFNIIFPCKTRSQVICSLQVFQPKVFLHFSCPPCVLRAPNLIFLDLISLIIRLTFTKCVYCGGLSDSNSSHELFPLISTTRMLVLTIDYTAALPWILAGTDLIKPVATHQPSSWDGSVS
jgi:hypothetical protein